MADYEEARLTMKPKIAVAWEHLGAVGGTRYDASKWTEDRSTLWVTLWSDQLKRVSSGGNVMFIALPPWSARPRQPRF